MPIVLAALAAALIAEQEAPPPKPAAEDNTVAAVVVSTDAAPAVQTSIDRRSYSLGQDLQATTGSLADALRNLPGVNVDLQGELALRGDARVTILIDGKPAGQFEGPARADALQQLPADQFERVEVMTNPSAAINPDGSGGVINLIRKTSRGAGWTRSIYTTAGSAGLKRAGLNFGYNSKALSLTGALTASSQRNKSRLHELRALYNPLFGAFEDHFVDGVSLNVSRMPTANLNLAYEATGKDRLTGALTLSELRIDGAPYGAFEDRNAAGAVTGLLQRQGDRDFLMHEANASVGWRHSFAGEGHQLSIDLIRNGRSIDDETLHTTLAALPPVPLLERISIAGPGDHSEARAVYTRPMAGSAKLVAGYEWKLDDSGFDGETMRSASEAALTPVPGLGFGFDYRLAINAAYATYERPIGDLTLQVGLRLEDARMEIFERLLNERGAQDYFRAFPSLHLSYRLDDERKLSAAYTQRIQRPSPVMLTPSRTYVDPKNLQEGNPALKPQETQSFELGYERRKGRTLRSATAYYRENKGEFTLVLNDQGDGVILVGFDNLGSSRSAGLELVANGALSKALTYSLNGNLFWNEIDAANLGFGRQSAYGVTGKANLNWQVRPEDLLQLNVSRQGRQLVAQGDVLPNWTLNLGWRHKLTDRVTATVSVQDALKTSRFRRRFDTPALVSRFENRAVSRAIVVRLDYRFGGAAPGGRPPADPQFEYGGGGG